MAIGVCAHMLHFQREYHARQSEIAALKHLLAQPRVLAAPTETRNPKNQFYESLGSVEDLDHLHQVIHDIGSETGISVSQADFTFKQVSSSIAVYEATLPFKAHYADARMFIEKTLLAIPFASLNELHIKRSELKEATVEVQLKFKFYIDLNRKMNSMGVD